MTESASIGVVGVFATSGPMLDAARRLRSLGLDSIEAYTPYPIDQAEEAFQFRGVAFLPSIMALGALVGAAFGYFIQYWDEWLNYPLNVGGRPHNSWPAFTVGAFELTLLFAIAAGFFGLWFACRLPRLYDPKLEADAFERASIDRFVLRAEASEPSGREQIRRVFADHGAEQIVEVAG